MTGLRTATTGGSGTWRGVEGLEERRAIFLALGLEDVRRAAEVLRPIPTSEPLRRRRLHLAFECTPDLADDSDGTIEQAARSRIRLDLANVLIKVPGAEDGVPSHRGTHRPRRQRQRDPALLREPVEQVIEAYPRGLERHAARRGTRRTHIGCTFFVSRVDAEADRRARIESPLHRRIEVANAQRAYDQSLLRLAGRAGGARRRSVHQAAAPALGEHRSKNATSAMSLRRTADHSGVIDTMPEATLRAFGSHGKSSRPSTPTGRGQDRAGCRRIRGLGLDGNRPRPRTRGHRVILRLLTGEFLRCIETKLAAISGHGAILA